MHQNQFKLNIQEAYYQKLMIDYEKLKKDLRKEKKKNKEFSKLKNETLFQIHSNSSKSPHEKLLENLNILDNFIVDKPNIHKNYDSSLLFQEEKEKLSQDLASLIAKHRKNRKSSQSSMSNSSVQSQNFRLTAQNVLKSNNLSTFAENEVPLDLLTYRKLLNRDFYEEEIEEIREIKNSQINNDFTKTLDKQNGMLEYIIHSMEKEKNDEFNDKKSFVEKKMQNLEKNPQNLRNYVPLDYNLIKQKNHMQFNDPLEILHKFKKDKEKNQIKEPPTNIKKPFINPLGGPLGMKDIPLQIMPVFNQFDEINNSLNSSPFENFPNFSMKTHKKKMNNGEKKYKRLMKEIVLYIFFRIIFNFVEIKGIIETLDDELVFEDEGFSYFIK